MGVLKVDEKDSFRVIGNFTYWDNYCLKVELASFRCKIELQEVMFKNQISSQDMNKQVVLSIDRYK